MNKYLYKIKDLEVPPWLKYWFARKSKVNFDLSQILNGTSFDLTDTVNKKLHLINIFGNSEQETRSGKNRIKLIAGGSDARNGITAIVNNDLSITLNGTATEDTSISFSRLGATIDNNVISGNTLSVFFVSGTWTTSNPTKSAFRIYNSNFSLALIVNQLNTLNNNNKVRYSTYQNNDLQVSNWNTSFFIPEGDTLDNFTVKLMLTDEVDTEYEEYGAMPSPDYPSEIKSTGDNGYIVEKFTNSDNTQLQIYTIPCQQPMRAIGDVKDTFVKIDEVWYERHIIEKGVLGTENYRVATYYEAPDKPTADSFNTAFFGIIIPYTALNTNFLSNRFIYTGETYWATDKEGLQLTMSDNRFRMRIEKNKLDGYDNDLNNTQKCRLLSDYLNNNLTEVLYSRVEPLDLPCTQAQITELENLQKARTYKDVTHIYTDDEVPADLQIQYYKEKGE